MIDVINPKVDSVLLDDHHKKSIYSRIPQIFGEPSELDTEVSPTNVLRKEDQKKLSEL